MENGYRNSCYGGASLRGKTLTSISFVRYVVHA
jgi:hypothetical protein